MRRIEAAVGGNEIVLKDRVLNHGFCRTPHMYCYHINIGHPVLSEGSLYLAPIAETVWAAHAGEKYREQGIGYRRLPGPRHSFHEQVWQHEMKGDANALVPAAIVNDEIGFGVLVETNKTEFPAQFQWQNFQAGLYAIGIEPSTNHVFGKPFAKQRGELIWLEHGEERSYTTRFEVLDGSHAIAAAKHRIETIAAQPRDEYPEPSGRFASIPDRN